MFTGKRLMLIGSVLIVLAGVWKFGLGSRWEKRYPEDWAWNVEIIGGNWFPASADDNPPTTDMREDPLSISTRDISIEYKGDKAEIRDEYTSFDATTNAITWNDFSTAELDPQTGAYSDADDEYYFFPRHVDKDTTYKIRNSSYPTLLFKFEEEEAIEGLNTYRFGYHGAYPNASGYSTVTLEANQDIRCVMLDLQFWVEPVTGEVVKYYEACAGDEIFDTTTDAHVTWLGRWWGEPKPEAIVKRASEVKEQRDILLWATRYLPLGLLLVGLSLVVAGIWYNRQSPATPHTPLV